MSKRNKLEKFSDLVSFPNVYEYSEKGFESNLAFNGSKDVKVYGNWKNEHFKNEGPIILELACGRGEYTCALAKMYPKKNFIGIDVKGARIWKGASYALKNLPNAAFLRIRIEHIAYFFAPEEIEEIWITFPDPFLKEKKSNRRLTSPEFLSRYQKVIRNNGMVNLKTDDDQLYRFTMDTVSNHGDTELVYHNKDIYLSELFLPELEIKTFYERKHLLKKKTIKFVRFSLKNNHSK